MAWIADQNYKRRKKITITGQSGAGTNYQILLKIGESSGATGEDFDLNSEAIRFPGFKNDGGDLAFTASDGSTLLDFWVEYVTGSSPNRLAYVWVEVSADLGSNQDIYIYYRNNGNPTNYSNGANTFNFFDDFTGRELDTTTNWDTSIGSGPSRYRVADSTILQNDDASGGSYTQIATKTATWNAGYAVRMRQRRTGTATFANGSRGFLALGNNNADVGISTPVFENRIQAVHTGGTATNIQATPTIVQNTWYVFDSRWISSSKSVHFCLLDSNYTAVGSTATITDGVFSTNSKAGFRSADTMVMETDWFFIRKTQDTEPAFSSVTAVENFSEPSSAWLVR